MVSAFIMWDMTFITVVVVSVCLNERAATPTGHANGICEQLPLHVLLVGQ
jgi:hypothetical protein